MEHTKVTCSTCNKEMLIMIGKYSNGPDKIICKACSQCPPMGPQKVKMNLGVALEIAKKENPRKQRCFGRTKKWNVVNRYLPTHDEAGQRKRIHGSD